MNFAVNFEVVVDYLDKVAADGNAICPKEPWQVQEFVTGSEYSACCVVRNSQLLLVTVCRSSASQLNYVECRDQRLVSSIQAFMTKLVQDTLPPNTDGMFCLGSIIVKETPHWGNSGAKTKDFPSFMLRKPLLYKVAKSLISQLYTVKILV